MYKSTIIVQGSFDRNFRSRDCLSIIRQKFRKVEWVFVYYSVKWVL